jgi:Mor family transcriptional regulator
MGVFLMLDYLTKEDLPESLRDIVDAIDMDSVKELIRLAGGSSLYIPNESSVTKPVRDKIIKEFFNGNYK